MQWFLPPSPKWQWITYRKRSRHFKPDVIRKAKPNQSDTSLERWFSLEQTINLRSLHTIYYFSCTCKEMWWRWIFNTSLWKRWLPLVGWLVGELKGKPDSHPVNYLVSLRGLISKKNQPLSAERRIQSQEGRPSSVLLLCHFSTYCTNL